MTMGWIMLLPIAAPIGEMPPENLHHDSIGSFQGKRLNYRARKLPCNN